MLSRKAPVAAGDGKSTGVLPDKRIAAYAIGWRLLAGTQFYCVCRILSLSVYINLLILQPISGELGYFEANWSLSNGWVLCVCSREQ